MDGYLTSAQGNHLEHGLLSCRVNARSLMALELASWGDSSETMEAVVPPDEGEFLVDDDGFMSFNCGFAARITDVLNRLGADGGYIDLMS